MCLSLKMFSLSNTEHQHFVMTTGPERDMQWTIFYKVIIFPVL